MYYCATCCRQALSPAPAALAAAPGLGTQTKNTAAELEGLLRSRGASLPSLTSSPSVGGDAGDAGEGGGGRSRAASSELLRDLKRENRQLREELDSGAVAPPARFSAPLAVPEPVPAPLLPQDLSQGGGKVAAPSRAAPPAREEAEEKESGSGLAALVSELSRLSSACFRRLLRSAPYTLLRPATAAKPVAAPTHPLPASPPLPERPGAGGGRRPRGVPLHPEEGSL